MENDGLLQRIFPTDIYGYGPYVPKRLYAGKPEDRGWTIYTDFFIGHNKPIDEIREGMQDWLRKGNHGLYSNMLQVEDPTEIGFLLYSTREMDAGALADEIKSHLKIEVGLRWKVINNGIKNLPPNQQVRALIVQ